MQIIKDNMQIIKDNQITNDTWEHRPDDTELGDGDVTISLARLQQNGKESSNRKGKLGVRILPSDSLEGIADYLPKLALIELHFPELADGRLFSHAWLLRNRYHYTGEIRATGHYLPDQVFYLSRVGVNSFFPEKSGDLSVTLASLNDFSVKYQPSVN
jgi:uncharacterized protein (DUF934 family)